MKVAIPVNGPEEEITIRTGRALYFVVYKLDLDEKSYYRLRLDENLHGWKHHHNEDHDHAHGHGHGKGNHRDEEKQLQNHLYSLDVIGDCDYLLAVAVGPVMKKALEQLNIQHIKFKKKDGQKAPDFLETLLNEPERLAAAGERK